MEISQESSRFKLWSIHLAFNVIILFSVITVDVQLEDQVSNKKWAIGLSIFSLLLTSITTYAYFHDVLRGIILNTKIEFYTILNILILQIAIVALVSSPTNGLAVENDGAVYLANLYYFSWAAFGNIVILLASYVEDRYGISVRNAFHSVEMNNIDYGGGQSQLEHDDMTTRNNATDTAATSNNITKTPSMSFIYWFGLMTTSIIVMATSSDIYNRNCEVGYEFKPQPFCSQTTPAIVIGVMSTISCLLIIVGKLTYYSTPFLLEVLVCLILTILYIFELYSVTRADAPGAPLGNLYYFSWFSFLLCLGVGKCCYEDYVYALDVAEAEFQGERSRRRTNVPSLQNHDVEDGDDDDHHQYNRQSQQELHRNGKNGYTKGNGDEPDDVDI